jgi:hypothetical protein
LHCGHGAGKADLPIVGRIDPIGERQKFHVLLGDQERQLFAAELLEHCDHLFDSRINERPPRLFLIAASSQASE